jgi:hypothetical protein
MRRRIAFAVLPALAAVPLRAQSTSLYAPGAHRYEVSNVLQREQETLGDKQTFEMRVLQQLSMELARSARDTLSFTMTLDSTSSTTPDGAELPNLNGLKGVGIRGTMSSLGKVYRYDPLTSIDEETAKEVQAAMSRLLPVFPKGTGVGTTWADTNVTTMSNANSDLRTTTIVTSTVLADTTYDGQSAVRVQKRFAQSVTGSGAQLGETMKIEGSGSGEGMIYVSRSGVYLASTTKITSRTLLTLTPSGLSIPVTTTQTSIVKHLPAR